MNDEHLEKGRPNELPALVVPKKMELSSGIKWTRCGLGIPEKTSEEAWQDIGAKLKLCEVSLLWAVGDWYNFGTKKYGEKRAQKMADAVGLRWHTVVTAAWVCRRVELSRRQDNLSFSHHSVIASKSPKEQKKWLALAVEHRMAEKTLRESVAADKVLSSGEKGPRNPKPPPLIPKCGGWSSWEFKEAGETLRKVLDGIPGIDKMRPQFAADSDASESNNLESWVKELQPLRDVYESFKNRLADLKQKPKRKQKPEVLSFGVAEKEKVSREVPQGYVGVGK